MILKILLYFIWSDLEFRINFEVQKQKMDKRKGKTGGNRSNRTGPARTGRPALTDRWDPRSSSSSTVCPTSPATHARELPMTPPPISPRSGRFLQILARHPEGLAFLLHFPQTPHPISLRFEINFSPELLSATAVHRDLSPLQWASPIPGHLPVLPSP